MNNLSRPSVSMAPKRTFWPRLSLRIVDSFFVRASDDPVRHDDTLNSVTSDELHKLPLDVRILPQIGCLREPTLEIHYLVSVVNDDSHGQLGRMPVIRTVERHSGRRVATKAPLGLPPNRLGELSLPLHARASSSDAPSLESMGRDSSSTLLWRVYRSLVEHTVRVRAEKGQHLSSFCTPPCS